MHTRQMIVLLAHKGHQTLCSDRRVIATPPERNKKGIDRYLGRICMFHEQTAYERRHLLCGTLEIGAHDGSVFHDFRSLPGACEQKVD